MQDLQLSEIEVGSFKTWVSTYWDPKLLRLAPSSVFFLSIEHRLLDKVSINDSYKGIFLIKWFKR